MSAESPFALPKLLAFAESKSASEGYAYDHCDICALAQFVLASGGAVVEWAPGKPMHYAIAGQEFRATDKRAIGPAYELAIHGDSTFGALATRLRAALKDERT